MRFGVVAMRCTCHGGWAYRAGCVAPHPSCTAPLLRASADGDPKLQQVGYVPVRHFGESREGHAHGNVCIVHIRAPAWGADGARISTTVPRCFARSRPHATYIQRLACGGGPDADRLG